MNAAPIMVRMEKKKRRGRPPEKDRHKTPRKPMQLPVPWIDVAKQIARNRPMPAVWLVVRLIADEAARQGITDLPPFPWDEAKQP